MIFTAFPLFDFRILLTTALISVKILRLYKHEKGESYEGAYEEAVSR